MSSKRWPARTLRTAIKNMHALHPLATAPQLAAMVGCSPACARVTLKALGATFVRDNMGKALTWTPEMKRALLDAALSRKSVDSFADEMDVHKSTLVLGAFEIIRELAAHLSADVLPERGDLRSLPLAGTVVETNDVAVSVDVGLAHHEGEALPNGALEVGARALQSPHVSHRRGGFVPGHVHG